MRVYERLLDGDPDFSFKINQITFLVFEAMLKVAMGGVASLDVPLLVEVGVGGNWDEAH